jgi:hypothetical protein
MRRPCLELVEGISSSSNATVGQIAIDQHNIYIISGLTSAISLTQKCAACAETVCGFDRLTVRIERFMHLP